LFFQLFYLGLLLVFPIIKIHANIGRKEEVGWGLEFTKWIPPIIYISEKRGRGVGVWNPQSGF
jgi:hypothetical protein